MTVGFCALCNMEKELLISHSIPRFVSKWLKNTAATGFFRNINGKRQQDVIKYPLLCRDCEEKFSIFEKYFAENFFIPFNSNSPPNNVNYDERLLKFIISLSWRILYDYIQILNKKSHKVPTNLIETLDNWKSYLLDLNPKLNINSHYLWFWDEIKEATGLLYQKFEWYLHRGVDATYASNKEKTIEFIFIQLPSFTIISSINPPKIDGFEEILIINNGKYSIPFTIDNNIGFIDFMNTRVSAYQKMRISDNEKEKIKKSALRDHERLRDSKSKKIALRQAKLNRLKDIRVYYLKFLEILKRDETDDNNLTLNEILQDLKESNLFHDFENSPFNVKDLKKRENDKISNIFEAFEHYFN